MKTDIAMREDKMAIEYIDREKAKRLLHIEYAYAAEQLLDEVPAVDVAPVVRCKGCKYNIGTKKCLNPDSFFAVPKDDDFCSYGERKDGGAK